MPTKIFVGNLDVESTPELEEELKSLFAQFGEVVECAILTGKNFGFVHMEKDDEAKIAVAGLNGHDFHGSPLNVELSQNQGSRGNKGGGGRGGRAGGRGVRGSDTKGRSRGRGGRGDGRSFGRDRREPYERRTSRYADPYDDPYASDPYAAPRRTLRDPYADDPYLRDPYARDPYADPYLRDPYLRDPYARDPYARDPYARDPYARDPYARPPPDYYSRLRDPFADHLVARARDPYAYERAVGREEELVAYPAARATNGYAKDAYATRE